ncbi:DUF3798 domain-containing protein [Anoxynatronum sibiricum]|uniref:DUF3798 domain-containing protein n=1 Tax=Anoxynatronum sibiricum TaxID=210623 RepID=A0ABU9VVZ4_9CLOT
MNKKIAFLLAVVLLLVTACGSTQTSQAPSGEQESKSQETASVETGAYKIAIVTPTLSASEDEFRAGQNMVEKYPDIVKHISLPDNFTTEVETGVSQIVSLADDPEMKAIVIAAGYSGLITGLQQVKEQRPDIITVTAPIWDDPEMMAQYIDINLDTDWGRRGVTIAEKAHQMGAETFIHYSFPTHLGREMISRRKDMMQETCERLGLEFVEVVTPDPQAGDGVAPMLQFLREDLPRQVEKYGPDINIFGTNCPMYDVILDEALKLKFMVAEQCCPTPTQAYPAVMSLEIAPEDIANYDKINAMISEKAAAADMTGRLSGWPMPVTIFLPEYAVELAKEIIDKDLDIKTDVMNKKFLDDFSYRTFGVNTDFEPMNGDADNFYLMIMESIFY